MFGWVWTIAPLWWFVLAVSGGLLLLIVGWWGRRIGDEPRCRKCGYILLELPTTICPDCGTDFARRKPRRGVRRVRVIPTIAGGLVLLFVTSPAVWMFRNANWRAHAPHALLLAAIDFGDEKAESELAARIALGGVVSDSQLRIAANRALAAQRDAALGSARLRNWLELLGFLDRRDLLIDSEWILMIQQCARDVSVQARPRCREDRQIPIRLCTELALPTGMAVSWMTTFRICEQSETAGAAFFAPDVPLPGLGTFVRQRLEALAIHKLAAGDYLLQAELQATLTDHANQTGLSIVDSFCRGARPSRRGRIRELGQSADGTLPDEAQKAMFDLMMDSQVVKRVPCRVTIVPRGSNADLDVLTGPEVRKVLFGHLRTDLMRVQTGNQNDRTITDYLQPTLCVQSGMPWMLAFEVRVRSSLMDEKVETFVYRPESGVTERNSLRRDWSDLQGETVELVLIPDPEPVRRSLELTYVAESISLGPLFVSPSASRPTAAAPEAASAPVPR